MAGPGRRQLGGCWALVRGLWEARTTTSAFVMDPRLRPPGCFPARFASTGQRDGHNRLAVAPSSRSDNGEPLGSPTLRLEVGFVVSVPVIVLVALLALLGFVLAVVFAVPAARRQVDWRGLAVVLVAIAAVLGAVSASGGV